MKAKIWNFSAWIEPTEPAFLIDFFNLLLGAAGLTVLNYQEHKFTPQGYTGLWLLAESHFAVHTFPEHGGSYIELSSCNAEKKKEFLRTLAILKTYDESEKTTEYRPGAATIKGERSGL